MAKDRRLEGRVALVTGGARGIGLAIATRFVAEGAKVVIGDIDVDEVQAAAKALGAGDDVLAHALDVTREQEIAAAVSEAETRFGRLDILVNNAAIQDMTTWDDLTYTHYQEVLRINLDGALLCSMMAVPALERAGGGRILNTASIMGLVGSKESIPYSTAKGGLINLTRCLACDLADKNITVNAIAPGFIDTRMAVTRHGEHEHQTEYFKTVYLKYGKIPLGRAGTPDDIAGPALFLCSDDACYVTGQILTVDGGVTMTF